ncbi:transcription-repair coupling factor [Aliikangiella marina]|uniref:Transcription-repair-coupling factor n=1 Tax=Aliikangiella marina TaxID=1712262 RepID=A0A545TJ20_9GAMM|nr:transcription-repair coupling factor [Aliikangiella marina]TQV77166.1 transcription-repair coupling factor [Aliikangiella marina]
MHTSLFQLIENNKLRAGYTHYVNGVHGSAFALSVAEAAREYGGLIVVLLPDAASSFSLKREIGYFLGKTVDEYGERTSDIDDIPVVTLPDWETLPYDYFSPHQDIISERLQTLYRLPRLKRGIVLMPISSALQKLPPREYIETQCLQLKVGQTIDIESLRINLTNSGYSSAANVMEHGEFAVRGSIIDMYPMGTEQPIRIELFDDEIESLRYFDPDNQLTTEKVSEINLLPAREYPTDESAIATFRQNWRGTFDSNIRESNIYRDVSNGIFPAGIEYYLPIFFNKLSTIFDFIDSDNLLMIHQGDISEPVKQFWTELNDRYEQYRYDIERPIVEPQSLYLRAEELNQALSQYPDIQLTARKPTNKQSVELGFAPCPKVTIDHKLTNPVGALQSALEKPSKALICAESPGRQEVLRELFAKHHIAHEIVTDWREFSSLNQGIALTIAPVQQGFVESVSSTDDAHYIVICEADMFGSQVLQSRRRQDKGISPDQLIHSLAELKTGDPVVHVDQGVGRYLGLQSIDAGGMTSEFLTLEYSGGDKLYVPVQSLHLIHRYSGSNPETAPWHKLGAESWSKAKTKAMEKARDTAAELLDLYAQRAAEKGISHKISASDYEKFASEFEFEATPDQEQAIAAVIKDMKASTPMDRLVCGDVGFGKTEVAMRAAFVAIQSGMQVAMLVPTTLLAQQHFNSFQDRFSQWPVNVGVLSRFQTKKEQEAILNQLASGQIDIVIGTHRLLMGKPTFKNLGLLLIDEEHRFGVRQKEVLKSYRAKVDILTLTATPIPRTLNMSMSGMRDLSIIATPPAKRLAIKTFVRQHNTPLIKEAIQREIRRGGQVYFLHNSVDSIERTAREIQDLMPEIKVAVAHGQMRERELEDVMKQFYHQQYHVLVCTTIIETGIDVPTANTIIMDRADKLGLAQLHQLRGRVGRSHHQAYAYLLTPPPKTITKDARKRLEAIENLEDLGAGFILATHDLEIRGAGELLGDEQSGHMQTIGFSMYMELLDGAVKALKSGQEPSLKVTQSQQTEVNLGASSLLPDTFVPDVGIRLSLYKRIANAKDEKALKDLQIELIDRFGLLPEPAKVLFSATELKLRLSKLGVVKLEANDSVITVEFNQAPTIDTSKLINLIQTNPSKYKLLQGTTLKVTSPNNNLEHRRQQIDSLIESLTS